MEIKEKKDILEGNLAGTSPATDEEEGVGLNNTTVPTEEEEQNAGIEATQEPSPESLPEESIQPNQDEEPENNLAADQLGGDETGLDDEAGIAETSATEPMFTQSQVDEIAGKVRKETREKVTKDIFSRYGVNSADELDNLFGDAQRFETIKGQYDEDKKAWNEADAARSQELNELKESVALLSSGIDRNRYEDAKFILRGKGLEVTAENIEAELATHPEWKAEASKEPPLMAEAEGQQMPFRKIAQEQGPSLPPKPATTINVLGNEAPAQAQAPELSDYEKAMKMFKV